MNCLLVVCTRNRSAGLGCLLESLTSIDWSEMPGWSVLVVDNGSTDDTPDVCERHQASLPLKVVSEPRPGLSCARNRALAQPQWDAMVFTDDDITLDGVWLRAWSEAFEARPSSGWFGGPVVPLWPEGKPAYIRDDELRVLSGALGHHDLGGTSRAYTSADPFPIGANFGFRRVVAEQVGRFREDLGHVAGALGRGEETDWLGRAAALGSTGWYIADAKLGHPVPRSRLTLSYFWRLGHASGVARVRMGGIAARGSRLRQASQLVRGVRQLVLGRGDRFRQCVTNAGIEAGLRSAARGRSGG